MTEFLTTRQVGEKLGVTAQQVNNLVNQGRLPAVRHGRCIRIPRAAWEAWLAQQNADALASMNRGEAHAKAA